MATMRDMVNDIRDELKTHHSSVLCDIYDGQFHNIIVRSEKGEPLTRLQLAQDHFKCVMNDNSREDLANILLAYCKISDNDIARVQTMEFNEGVQHDLESITMQMNTYENDEEVFHQMFIGANPVENFSMSNIYTHHREYIWNRYLKKNAVQRNISNELKKHLTKDEVTSLLKGTKLHRQVRKHHEIHEYNSEDSDSKLNEPDPDYVPSESESDESEIDSSEIVEITDLQNMSTVTFSSTGLSCIRQILNALKELNNKHNWQNETVDTFLQKYLSSRTNMSKLFIYKLDIINSKVHENFNTNIFNKNDSKKMKVQKLYEQLLQMPQLLHYESSEYKMCDLFQPKTLFQIHWKFITSNKYPKEFLAAPVCQISHLEKVFAWESNSPIPLCLHLPCNEREHIIFNYLEFSQSREQIEMRTFDYTHIFNNLRFHICNKGFDDVRTKAFIAVSDVDNDILARTIVEDKLDRQNCDLLWRFFSSEVQTILTKC